MLIYWKIQASGNNLQVYKVRYSICLFQLSSIYHPVLSNKYNNDFSAVLSSCILTLLELFSKRSNHKLHSVHKVWPVKNINTRTTKWRYISALRDKEYSCFDFLAHSMFSFDVFWDSLGTSIFGNSSSVTNNSRSRLPTRLSFRFLWLWFDKKYRDFFTF